MISIITVKAPQLVTTRSRSWDIVTIKKPSLVISRGQLGPAGALGPTGATGPTGGAGPGAGYENPDPTTIAVGGIAQGSTFPTQQSVQQMFDALLYPFQHPGFTSFGISGVGSPLEVGASFGPDVTFTWGTSNSGNVATDSIAIAGVASGLPNTGSSAQVLGAPVTRTTAGTESFAISGEDTESNTFNDSVTFTWEWRLYYGGNASATLTGTQVLALAGSELAGGYAGTFVCAAAGFKFICLADAVGGQINSVKDQATGFNVPMAAGSHTDGGGFGYNLVSVDNVQGVTTNVRVYSTLNSLGGSVTLVVT